MGPILRKAFPLRISSDRTPPKLNFLSSSSWKKRSRENNIDIEKRQPSDSSSEFVGHKGMGMGQRSESTLTGQESAEVMHVGTAYDAMMEERRIVL